MNGPKFESSGLRPGEEEARIQDVKEAEVGAYAEKPIRDIAREPDVTEEQRAILDHLAGKRAERAMQEYAAEKEKNPVEKLMRRIEQIAEKMRQEELPEDAAIVERIPGRIQRYVESSRAKKAELEKRRNRRVTLKDLYEDIDCRPTDWLVVTHRIGEDGGWIYWPRGSSGGWFGSEQDLEPHRNTVEEAKAEGAEVVNFSFSEAGKTMFFRGLGVLREDEEAIDMPAVWERYLEEARKERGDHSPVRIDARHYRAYLPTNVPEVEVEVMEELPRQYDGKNEERIGLHFGREFHEAVFAEK
jgi:hypothetical protein